MLSQINIPIDDLKQTVSKKIEKKIIGIHGGGNIGLGLFADIVSKSKINFEVIATSNDKFLSTVINSTNQYLLLHGTDKGSSVDTLISGVKIIPRDSSHVIELYKMANIVAICLTPVVIASTVTDIAKGLVERHRHNKKNLDLQILVLMNVPKCGQFVRDLVANEIFKLVNNQEYANLILSKINFTPTVVDRIVTKLNENEVKSYIKNQLMKSSSYDHMSLASIDSKLEHLISDPEKLSEAIKKFDLKIPLFNAEENYALYVTKEFRDISDFPAMQQSNNLEQIEAVKNKFINGPHAIIAWLGALAGCKTISEAIRSNGISKYVTKMMDDEIGPALMAEFPDLTKQELYFLRELFIKRCVKSVDDPVIRVGRDPMRKINAHGRIRGTIELCKKHALNIKTNGLETGLAAAILYAVTGIDNDNPGCLKIRDIYRQHNRSYKAVLCYVGESPAGIFQGLDENNDKELINNILSQINFLEKYYRNIIKSDKNVVASLEHNLSRIPLLAKLKIFPQFKSSDLKDAYRETKPYNLYPLFMKNKEYMNLKKKLYEIGILLSERTGHIIYSSSFKPIDLNFDLVFIRHGETFGNCGQVTADAKIDNQMVISGKKDHNQRIFQGNVDTEINKLTLQGKRQALHVAVQLENKFLNQGWIPDAIFYSPLSRAKDTGLPFVERNGFENIYMKLEDLREISFGAWDNRRVCDLGLKNSCHLFYKQQNSLVKMSGINGNGIYQTSENFCEVLFRAYKVLKDLNQYYVGQKIIMFSHSMFGAACCILLGKGMKFENNNYLAFDGKRKDGSFYTMPNAVPYNLSMRENMGNSKITTLLL